MPELRFWEAEKTREKLTLEQKKFISSMYKDLSKKVGNQAEALKGRTNISSAMRAKYLKDLQKNINVELNNINSRINKNIVGNMTDMANAVVGVNANWLKGVGLDIQAAYSNVPRDTVEDLVSGRLYNKDWTLSKALWRDAKETQQDVQRVVAEGIAQNKPIYEIAKDLEKYVDPTKRKDWEWNKVYPGTKKVVDYTAQRLARTMVNHSYQNAFVRTTKDNPFFTGYRWLSGHSLRTCELCEDRATRDGFGMGAGVFPKDQLPMDHPNGLCTWAIVLEKPMKEVTKDIADWYHAPKGTYPEMDKYAKSFGYNPKATAKKVTPATPAKIVPKATPAVKPKATAKSVVPKTIPPKEPVKRFSSKGYLQTNAAPDKMLKGIGLPLKEREALLGRLLQSDVSDEFRGAFSKAQKSIYNYTSNKSKPSAFMKFSRTINVAEPEGMTELGDNPFATIFHEMGHAMDSMNRVGTYSYNSEFGFKAAMLEDMDELVRLLTKSGELSGNKLKNRLSNLKNDYSSSGVQDILGATRHMGDYYSELGKTRFSWGHSAEYWNRGDTIAEASSELFAHMTEAQVNASTMKYMKEYFPKALAKYEKIIELIASEIK